MTIRRWGLALLLAAAPLGCMSGSGDDSAPSASVAVALREFALVLDRATVPAGSVRIVAHNEGEDVHEVVVLRTDLGLGDLPMDADGDVDEEGAGVQAVGELEGIAPGSSAESTFDLAPGRYVFICNVSQLEPDGTTEHHYELGMRAALTVE